MQAMPMYRRWQFMAMEKNALNLEHIVKGIDDPAIFARRDGGDGWTIAEVLGHLCDFERFFHERARILAETDEAPPQPTAPPTEVVKARGYAEQDALDLLAQWQGLRAEHVAYLTALPADDAVIWQKAAAFGRGDFTLNDQVILTAYHDLDHLHQIVKIIRGL